MMPRVTVVTVVLNRREKFLSTLASVLSQNYHDVEYIVADGGSTDGTLDVIEQYRSRISIVLTGPDRGPYDAMNRAVDHATGEWIIFMHAGDQFHGDNVIAHVFGTAEYLKADVIYGGAVIDYGSYAQSFVNAPLHQMWKTTSFLHQSAFIRTEVMKRYRYDLRYRVGADHDFFYRAFEDGLNFIGLPDIICVFDGTEGITIRNIFTAIRDKRDIALRSGFRLNRWIYYQLFLMYAYGSRLGHWMLGKKRSEKLRGVIRKMLS